MSNNLPPASPGYGGVVLIVKPNRCWANQAYRTKAGTGQCTTSVEDDDDLGLCDEHLEEFRA